MTARCNLSCSYCVLENTPNQLKQELSLFQKMELIAHLYHKFGFRSLTLSGGETLIIGKNIPTDFILLLKFLKQFKSVNKEDNLQLQLYTNGIKLNEEVAKAMVGIIDEVSITIDSEDKETLKLIGRNKTDKDDYFLNALFVCKLLSDRGIKIKLHTVISSLNSDNIVNSSKIIFDSLQKKHTNINSWKFYQYMSYDVFSVDEKHKISKDVFETIKSGISEKLKEYSIKIHFKDNIEMNESLFNILAYGNAQYLMPGDTWSESKRTDILLNYESIKDMFDKNNISKALFDKYHSFKP